MKAGVLLHRPLAHLLPGVHEVKELSDLAIQALQSVIDMSITDPHDHLAAGRVTPEIRSWWIIGE